MKKKIISGVIALALISINIVQSIMNNQNYLSFQQLVYMYSANAEQTDKYTVEWGDNIGEPITQNYNCPYCSAQDAWKLVYQPQEVICENPGSDSCPDGGGKIISEGCSVCDM